MITKSRIYKDIVGAAIALALVAGYYSAASVIPKSSLIGDGIGADTIPRGLAIIASSLCLILLLNSVRQLIFKQYENAEKASPEERAAEVKKHLRAAGMLLIGVVYLLSFTVIGWAPAIFLLLLATAIYNGRSMSWPLVGFATVVTTTLFCLFALILGIPMPLGFLENLL